MVFWSLFCSILMTLGSNMSELLPLRFTWFAHSLDWGLIYNEKQKQPSKIKKSPCILFTKKGDKNGEWNSKLIPKYCSQFLKHQKFTTLVLKQVGADFRALPCIQDGVILKKRIEPFCPVNLFYHTFQYIKNLTVGKAKRIFRRGFPSFRYLFIKKRQVL